MGGYIEADKQVAPAGLLAAEERTLDMLRAPMAGRKQRSQPVWSTRRRVSARTAGPATMAGRKQQQAPPSLGPSDQAAARKLKFKALPKFFHPTHRIFRHIHETLNIHKKIN